MTNSNHLRIPFSEFIFRMRKNKNHIRLFNLMLLSFLVLLPIQVEAQKKKKKKNETVAVIETPEETITDLTKSSKKIEGLFTLYQDTITGDLQMLIKKDQINKEYIHFAQIADGVLDAGRINRGSYRGSKVFKIERYFNKIEFVIQNTSFYFDPDHPLSKSKNANISQGILLSLNIEAQDTLNGLYLIKANDLFLKETFKQIKPASKPETPATAFKLGALDKDKSKIRRIKNYPENTNLEVEYVYSKPSVLNHGSNAVSDARHVSIKVLHSLVSIPDNDYEIRLDDPRVGFFITKVDDKTSTSTTPYRDLVNRWHLKKKNPDAQLSEPVEPIVWWIENSTPHEWRETIAKGVLQWNVAFEKAGFKNAIQVKIQPDDAEWDAGDIRYNVLRWTSSPKAPFGGYGPRFVNPKTGQILGSDIMLEFVHFTNRVFYDKMYSSDTSDLEVNTPDTQACTFAQGMHEDLMYARTRTLVSGGSDLELERIKKEAMMGLIMHEVGHTLGLNHNMKASQLYSPEQLYDPDFTKGKCLAASVMDYTSINIVPDRTKQGLYDDVALGPYDIWAIQFGYTPFENDEERHDLLKESTKPEHIFGNDADDMRSPGRGIDPRVMIYDQSSDAITYSIDRIKLVDTLFDTLKDKFLKPNESYEALKRAHRVLIGQQGTAANIISRYIGGVYVDRAMVGQEGSYKPYTPVSYEDQKRAMNALQTYVFAPDAFVTPAELYNYLARQRRGFDYSTEDPKIHEQVLYYQKRVLAHLLHPNTLQRIVDSEMYGNTYKLSAVMTDLNTAIFKTDIRGNINSFRQNLQLEYTDMLIAILNGKQSSKYNHSVKSMVLYNLNAIKSMAISSGNMTSIAHKQHLKTRIDNATKEVK